MPTRIFRLVKLFRRRRDAAGADSPPSDLQPGELAVGENEGVLYYGKTDGSVVSLTSGPGGGGAVQSVAGRTGIVTLAKIDVGLSNVDNTSDANKPVSTAQQTALDLKLPVNSPILARGTLSGNNDVNFGSDRLLQTLTLAGSAVTFTKGAGWPATSVTADVILRITVTTATTITWTVVTDWFTQPPAGALNSGTHLFLLRAIGSSIIEGHYIGNKTN